ncbi:hypothetical protein [Actinomadura fibrosa]|uniref:Uncharacterized protein n=1 Tax=Actinomadura fibrosa TaxID=111802 RepID=A0ABW2XKC6_9ACTN|nr:hypothetical protein [Actinomadura fibrosa]
MSSTVEVYVADWRDAAAVAQRVAVALETSGYFRATHGYTYTIKTASWFTGPGVLTLRLTESDWDEDDPDLCTAFESYAYEVSAELAGVPGLARDEVLERVGRSLFDRLMVLGLPLAFGNGTDIFADFLPGRGVRDFPPGTDLDADGRDVWFEPRLHGTDEQDGPAPERTVLRRGTVTVFEVGGLVQLVPQVAVGGGRRRAVAPVASLRRGAGPEVIGRALAEVLDRSARPDVVVDADPWSWVTGTSRLDADAYARQAVSVDVELVGEVLQAVLHGAYSGPPRGGVAQGPVIGDVVRRDIGRWDDAEVGGVVLGLLSGAG